MHVEGPAVGMDVPSRPYRNVIPAHAGIQGGGNGLDARVRGNDDLAILWHVCFPEYITRSRNMSDDRFLGERTCIGAGASCSSSFPVLTSGSSVASQAS